MIRSCTYEPKTKTDWTVTQVETFIQPHYLRMRYGVTIGDMKFWSEWIPIDQKELIRLEKVIHKQCKQSQ